MGADMSTRIRITNTSKQPQDIGGRWLQPGGSDVFDLEQVPPEWRAAGVLVDVPDARVGELERVGDALYVRKADGSRNVLVEAATLPGGGIVKTIVALTQAAYDALPVKDAATLYVING